MRLAFLLLFFALLPLVSGHGNESFAGELIDSEVPCDDLSEEELVLIGDYFMELMHPGASHDRMDAMHGGEGSDGLRVVHLRMAEKFYCSPEVLPDGSQCSADTHGCHSGLLEEEGTSWPPAGVMFLVGGAVGLFGLAGADALRHRKD